MCDLQRDFQLIEMSSDFKYKSSRSLTFFLLQAVRARFNRKQRPRIPLSFNWGRDDQEERTTSNSRFDS